MTEVTYFKAVGNNVVAYYDDGSQNVFTPTPSEIWLPATDRAQPNGSGGEVTNPGTGGTPGTVASPVDDYPWPAAPQNSLSPLRYSYRDCTDFVAWRINRDHGCTAAPWAYTWAQLRISNGDAIGWRQDWISHGWTVDMAATAGCILWYGTSAGAYGHVCYVQAVMTSTILVEEYNFVNKQAYGTRTIPIPATDSSHSFIRMPPP